MKYTLSQYNKLVYTQGKIAKNNGYERISPYQKCIAEKYWLAGYDGIFISNFTNWHLKYNLT
jgi:hypothetical protein